MSYNNGIIQDLGANDGINVDDIRQAMGMSSGDLHTLCEATGRLKLLSKNKPIRARMGYYRNGSDRMDPIEGDRLGPNAFLGLMQRNLGFDIPVFSGSALLNMVKYVIRYSDQWSWSYSGAAPASGLDEGLGNGWVYRALRGSLTDYPDPRNRDFARYSDWNGYDSNQPRTYEDGETFVLFTEDARSIVGDSTQVSPKFYTKMTPLHPRNFYSLSDTNGGKYRLGVAFWTKNQENIFVCMSSGSNCYDSLRWEPNTEESSSYVIVPNNVLNTYLHLVEQLHPNDVCTIYCVGFFAPEHDSDGLSGLNALAHVSNLRPIPGICYTTITHIPSQPLSGFIMMTGVGGLMAVGQTSTRIQLLTVTNYYTLSTTTFMLYSRALRFTFDVINPKTGAVLESETSYKSFSSFSVNVTNDDGQQHTKNIYNDNCYGFLSLIDRSHSQEGYKVVVYLWYTEGVSPTEFNPERTYKAGQFEIQITDHPSRE